MDFKEKGISEDIAEVIDLTAENSQPIEGEYLGSRPFKGKHGQSLLHCLRRADQKIIGFWGSTDLNKKLEGEEHNFIRASYLGKRDIREGESFKVFKVEIAS